MKEQQPRAGYREVFCTHVHRNGKVIYPKKAKYFHFWVKVR